MTVNDVGSHAIAELAVFADLGTDAPRAVIYAGLTVVRMVRNGQEIEIILHPDGSVVERDNDGGQERRHIDFRALIASANFGDLGRWADNQTTHLRERVKNETIELQGILSWKTDRVGLESIDNTLIQEDPPPDPSVHILLVDGPAGIGKTSFIRALAFRRAQYYRGSRHPLVLHVESRGRVLQNIVDLMAFSLQTLRLSVTYDQVPALVRHGLVTLAIDGFDELGDPNGYELAWAQVNELVADVRGQGSLLLAGRETLIGRDRLVTALKSFRHGIDELDTFTLQAITPSMAQKWLLERGWTESLFKQQNVVPLFEAGSYALRPFFF